MAGAVSSSSMTTEFDFTSIILVVGSSVTCTTSDCLSKLGINVAIETQNRTMMRKGVIAFLTATVSSSFSKRDMYPHRKPTKKVISNRIEPTIASPTLTGIFRNEENMKLTILDMFRLQNRKNLVKMARPKKLIAIGWASPAVFMNMPRLVIIDN